MNQLAVQTASPTAKVRPIHARCPLVFERSDALSGWSIAVESHWHHASRPSWVAQAAAACQTIAASVGRVLGSEAMQRLINAPSAVPLSVEDSGS